MDAGAVVDLLKQLSGASAPAPSPSLSGPPHSVAVSQPLSASWHCSSASPSSGFAQPRLDGAGEARAEARGVWRRLPGVTKHRLLAALAISCSCNLFITAPEPRSLAEVSSLSSSSVCSRLAPSLCPVVLSVLPTEQPLPQTSDFSGVADATVAALSNGAAGGSAEIHGGVGCKAPPPSFSGEM